MDGRTERRVRVHLSLQGQTEPAENAFTFGIDAANVTMNSLLCKLVKQQLPKTLASNWQDNSSRLGFLLLQLNQRTLLRSTEHSNVLRDDDHLRVCLPTPAESELYKSSSFGFQIHSPHSGQPATQGSAASAAHSDRALVSAAGAASTASSAVAASANRDRSKSSSSSSSSSSDSDSSSDSSSDDEAPQPLAAKGLSQSVGTGSGTMSSAPTAVQAHSGSVAPGTSAAGIAQAPDQRLSHGADLGTIAPLDISHSLSAALAQSWPGVPGRGGRGLRGKRPRHNTDDSSSAVLAGVTVRLPRAALVQLSLTDVHTRSIACPEEFLPSVGDVLQLSALASAFRPASECPAGDHSGDALQGEGGFDASPATMLAAMCEPETVLCRVVQCWSDVGVVCVCLGVAHSKAEQGAPVQWADAVARIKRDGAADMSAPAHVCVHMDGVISTRVLLGPSFALALLKQKREAKAFLQRLATNAPMTSTAADSSKQSQAVEVPRPETLPATEVSTDVTGAGTATSQNKRRRHSRRYHKVVAQRSLGVSSFLAKLAKEDAADKN